MQDLMTAAIERFFGEAHVAIAAIFVAPELPRRHRRTVDDELIGAYLDQIPRQTHHPLDVIDPVVSGETEYRHIPARGRPDGPWARLFERYALTGTISPG